MKSLFIFAIIMISAIFARKDTNDEDLKRNYNIKVLNKGDGERFPLIGSKVT